jgi:FKBP-type peptidyl-prolyl cis-trans isomerase FkpA
MKLRANCRMSIVRRSSVVGHWSLVIGLIALMACNNNNNEKKLGDEEIKDRMANVNKLMVRDESKDIDEFIARHQWKMEKTGTGLRYEIYSRTNGRTPVEKDTVAISYKLFLMDGTEAYNAEESKPLRFILGRGEQPSGLEEGLMMMHEGESARFVVPYHLGYGMTGDENKIPAGASLYYDVKLLKVGSN